MKSQIANRKLVLSKVEGSNITGKSSSVIVAILVALCLIAAVISVVMRDFSGRSGSGLSESYEYDLSKYEKIDPVLILYEQTAAFDTGLEPSNSVVIHGDELFVAGEMQIRIFDLSGRQKQEIPLDLPPQAVALDESGTLWIVFVSHVEQYGRDGKRIAAWPPLNDKANLTSLAVTREDVYLADAGNRIVLRYDRSGKLKNEIGRRDDDREIPGFVIPSPHFDLTMAPDGLLRVINPGRHTIEAYTPRGDREFDFGSGSAGVEGFCGCCNPVAFAILPDGGFVTVEKGLIRVKIYDPRGHFVGVVAGPEQLTTVRDTKTISAAFDVAVD
ncbi:MAG: hypothetical protein GX455_14615, partial [Phycisphaerae bacterium]|nr:hypothetical protein [Phycisphaerae bacterium]